MHSALFLNIATLSVTLITGVALAFFAALTYKLSRSVTRQRFSPVLEVYPEDSPETGSFEKNSVRFYGVRWRLSLVNSGDVPIWVDNISVFVEVAKPCESEEGAWVGIGKLCELYDEDGSTLESRAIAVNGNNHRKITVSICREDVAERRLLKAGDTTRMRVEFLQRGKGVKPEGWLIERSESFQVPEKFGIEPIARLV